MLQTISHVITPVCLYTALSLFEVQTLNFAGAMKEGQGICGRFKPFNLTYLHVHRYIDGSRAVVV